MTMLVVRRRYVDEAVHTLLSSVLDFPVGLVEVPEGVDFKAPKYAVVTPIPGGTVDGGPRLTSPEAMAALSVDVTSVGSDRRQAEWVADEVRRVLCNHVSFPLVIAGHDEIDRSTDGTIGAVTLIDGVYQQVDSYVVTVERVEVGS